MPYRPARQGHERREVRKECRRALRRQMTPAEVKLWTLLRKRQLQGRRFRRQHPIGPFIVDFYCAAEQLAIELDGAPHHRPERRAYDAARTRMLADAGVRVVRFENRAVFAHPDAVLEAIARHFRS